MNLPPPIPENEKERALHLASFDLDYSDISDNLKDLTHLAAKVAGTNISLVNLIDTYTQWSVANYGHSDGPADREESVCQYTIMSNQPLEVKKLSQDERFKNKDYVLNEPHFEYYFGIPLQTSEGYNLGALCVVDNVEKEISPEKVELLKIIANEIVSRLVAMKLIEQLRNKVNEAKETQKRVAHDIRGPLGGIINLAEIIAMQGDQNKMDEVLLFMNMIHKSGRSILELADEILSTDKPTEKSIKSTEFNLILLKEKLEKLYTIQAQNKQVQLIITCNGNAEDTPFSKNKLLQIIGNLISNALKFTPNGGKVIVDLNIIIEPDKRLYITVKDTGIGLNEDCIQQILSGGSMTTGGTSGETGYGFGLPLVKHLIDSLYGTMKITSVPNEGACFEITLPQLD